MIRSGPCSPSISTRAVRAPTRISMCVANRFGSTRHIREVTKHDAWQGMSGIESDDNLREQTHGLQRHVGSTGRNNPFFVDFPLYTRERMFRHVRGPPGGSSSDIRLYTVPPQFRRTDIIRIGYGAFPDSGLLQAPEGARPCLRRRCPEDLAFPSERPGDSDFPVPIRVLTPALISRSRAAPSSRR